MSYNIGLTRLSKKENIMERQKKALKTTLIVMRVVMVCALLFLIYCIISFFSNKSSMEKYTSVMWGVVTDVDKKSDPRHGFYYKAYVTSENAPSMRFVSPSIKHEYIKGESVKIYYDPDNISDYYIEGAAPIGEDISMILTVLFMLIVVFVVHTIKSKQYKKLCSMDNATTE